MVFSYGFLDSSSTNARQLFLDLDIPADDPLRPAKIAVCNTTPGFRLFIAPGSDVTDWESSFVWWCCVNEEDGLEFRVVQSNQGERELKVSWKGTNVTSSESLLDQLKADRMWGVFQLRAVVILQDRMQGQLAQLRSNDEYVQRWLEYVDGRVIRQSVWQTALKLRTLEGELLEAGLRDIEAKVANVFAPCHCSSPSISSLHSVPIIVCSRLTMTPLITEITTIGYRSREVLFDNTKSWRGHCRGFLLRNFYHFTMGPHILRSLTRRGN